MGLIDAYLENAGEITRDNANHNRSFSGLQAYIANETLKEWALKFLTGMDKDLYRSGALHIHNLESGFLIPYCHGGSLQKLLALGIVSGDIVCKPAKHLDTAVDHITNYLVMSQQEFSGAQAFSDFNTLLAPFIRADKNSYREIKQCIQRLFFNLNFGTRSNFQTPFTNLTFNLNCPKQLADTPAMVGGKPLDSTYGDYDDESGIIAKACAEAYLEGDGSGRPLTFPIPTLNLTKDVDRDSEAYNAIIGSVVKLGSWYFMNYVGSGIDENNVRAMCCRLNLNLKELASARGLWNAGDGTGSLGVVSLNLGRLGYLARKGLDEKGILAVWMDSARRILRTKRAIVKESLESGDMPMAKYYGLNLDHYFNTIGIIGLNEYFVNKTGYGTAYNIKEAGSLLDTMNRNLRGYQEEDGVLYNLEMTPGEGSCYSLALKDRKQYPDIYTQGCAEEPYYSTLLTAPSEAIEWNIRAEMEQELLPKFSGGTIFRMYLAREDTPEHTKWIIDRLASSRIPYFDFTPTVSYCPGCGNREIGVYDKCRKCGGPTEVWSRVVGYVRPVHKWNKGKQREFRDRTYVEYG